MSKPGTIYRLNWQSFHETEDIQCYVDISDYDNLIDDGDTEDIVALTPSEFPAQLSIINNSEDPFSPIRAKQLTIGFVSDSNYSMSTFANGSDQRWGVHYYIGVSTKTVFKGWLVLDDLSEPLLAPANEVTLTATDNLGSLKDVKLTNDEELVLVGKYKIIDIIAYCLKKTGLELDIRVAFNIKQSGDETDVTTQNSTDEHFFTQTYLDAYTFEEEIGVLENCYSVLEKVVGPEAFITQSRGQWWIVRIDEIEGQNKGLYVTSFDSDGVFSENRGEKDYEKFLYMGSAIQLSEEASTVKATRPNKSVRLTYNYDYPRDLPYNVSLREGDLDTTVSPTQKRYVADGWRLLENLSTPTTPTGELFVEIILDSNGYETERYLLLTSPISPTSNNLAVSHPIEVHKTDRFTLSFDTATSTDMTGSALTYTQRVATIRLVGHDGTYWMMDSDGVWYQSNSTWSSNFKDIERQFVPNDTDTTEFYNFSLDSDDIPTDGDLYIDFYALNQQVSAIDDVDIKFNNINFEYKPFVDGGYRTYQGQYFECSQTGDYKAKVEDEVFTSDGPRKLCRGAFRKIDSWITLYSGAVEFSSPKFFTISGYYQTHFFKGQILRVTGTTNNNYTTRVTQVEYGIGTGLTIVRVEATTTVESDASTLIEAPRFGLANSFYNAAVYTSGVGGDTTLLHPYGHIQAFDVWNQYNIVKRVVQGTMQGLELDEQDADTLVDCADIIHKWALTDVSNHLISRRFQLLGFNQNHDHQGWTGTFRELVDFRIPKDYTTIEFKYLE